MGKKKNIVVLYGIGGLSDVGRHAVLAGLERTDDIDHVTILTQHPDLLEESNWNCGCEEPHSFTEKDRERMTIVHIEKSWKETDLSPYLKDITTIISCVGNRQPFFGHYDSSECNESLIRAMEKVKNDNENKDSDFSFRVAVITTVGINEDWPALEFFTIGRIAMTLIFLVFARKMYHDLTGMENMYRSSADFVNYLLVRPVGISEDVKPIGSWVIQRQKYKHPLGFEMAKLDVARYMLEECINPTRNRSAVVIGADPEVPVLRTVIPKK